MIDRAYIKRAIDKVLEAEGGYVNDADDFGGATNYGVTRVTLARHLGVNIADVSNDDVRAMSIETARQIYEKSYVYGPSLHLLTNPWIFEYAVDCWVNHAPKTAGKILQKAARPLITVDGIVGPKTREALNKIGDDPVLLKAFKPRAVYYRLDHFALMCRQDPTQLKFLRGWNARAMKFLL